MYVSCSAIPTAEYGRYTSEMHALIYLRISSDPSGLRAGVDRQREDCISLCERRSWSYEVFEDNDVSAYSGKKRPGWQMVLDAIESRRGAALVAWAPDRFTRQLRELEDLVGLVERFDVQVVTVQAGDWDLSTPEGRFMARQLGLLARLSSEQTAARVSRARRSAAESGKPAYGGPRPWGFEDDRVTHRAEEVADIRWAAQHLLSGGSVYSCSKRTNLVGYNLKRALLSPRMIGRRSYKGETFPASWAPILDEETWLALHALYSTPGLAVSSEKEVKYLLSGIALCVCGSPVVGGRNRLKAPAYACRKVGCNKIKRAAEPLDDWFRDEFLCDDRVELPSVNRGVDPALYAAVKGFETRLKQAKEMFEDGALNPTEYLAMKNSLETKLLGASQTLSEALALTVGFQPLAITGGPLLEAATVYNAVGEKFLWWDDADLKQKRTLIKRYVRGVQLKPAIRGKRFDSSACEILWR